MNGEKAEHEVRVPRTWHVILLTVLFDEKELLAPASCRHNAQGEFLAKILQTQHLWSEQNILYTPLSSHQCEYMKRHLYQLLLYQHQVSSQDRQFLPQCRPCIYSSLLLSSEITSRNRKRGFRYIRVSKGQYRAVTLHGMVNRTHGT